MINWKRGAVRHIAIVMVCVLLIWLGWRWLGGAQSSPDWWSRPRPKQSCPLSSQQFRYCEVPPVSKHLQHYASRIFSNSGLIQDNCERFTVIMMTYKRLTILPRVLTHYCQTPLLDKIIVQYNTGLYQRSSYGGLGTKLVLQAKVDFSLSS